MFPSFRDSGPFLNLLPFPTGGGSSVTVTPGTPSVVGTEITFPATSDRSLVGAVYGVEFGIGVSAGYVWSESVAGAASSQTITIDIATYGGTTSSVVNARLYYNLDPLDDPSTRVYSAMLAPIVVSASLSGTTTEGQTLTGANGIIVGGYQMTLSQSWSACNTAGTSCTPITAGTATTYVLTASEVGDTIKYTKTATNTAGSGSATSAASAVVASAVTILRQDNFNRADSAVTIQSPSDGGSNYIINSGTWGISGNQGYLAVAGTQRTAVLETSQTNIATEVTIAVGSGDVGVVVRGLDDDNYIVGTYNKAGGQMQIYRRVAGAFTQIGSTYNGTLNDGDVIKLSVDSGNNLVLSQNGVSRVTGNSAAGSTNTKGGIRSSNDTTTRFENLVIYQN